MVILFQQRESINTLETALVSQDLFYFLWFWVSEQWQTARRICVKSSNLFNQWVNFERSNEARDIKRV